MKQQKFQTEVNLAFQIQVQVFQCSIRRYPYYTVGSRQTYENPYYVEDSRQNYAQPLLTIMTCKSFCWFQCIGHPSNDVLSNGATEIIRYAHRTLEKNTIEFQTFLKRQKNFFLCSFVY